MLENEYLKACADYIFNKYADEIEFPWGELSGNAVIRHHSNKKWYVVIMQVNRSKLGLDGDETVLIIDLKCDPLLSGSVIDGKSCLPGYHMNKEHWITLLLDGTVEEQKMFSLIDVSYELTK